MSIDLKIGAKDMKKIFSIILAFVLNLSLVGEANALLSISHFNLGTTIIENFEQQTGKKLTKSEMVAFLSGEVYADNGRFYLDKKTGIASDSGKFADEMSKFVNSSEEKWFILGIKAHILQDKETGKFLNKIFGGKSSSYKEYLNRCALIDSYFLQKSKLCIFNDSLYKSLSNFNLDQITADFNSDEICQMLGLPENKLLDFINLKLKQYLKFGDKYFLDLYGDLLKKTYESFDFKVELSDLQEQANNIVVASAVLATMASGKIKQDNELGVFIESEAKKLSDLCAKYLIKELHSDDYKEKSEP